MAERTLDIVHIVALRAARAALCEAAHAGGRDDVDAALREYVHAMLAADFGRPTICSLVAAALDANLPSRRGAAHRARRAQELSGWVALAAVLVDAPSASTLHAGGR